MPGKFHETDYFSHEIDYFFHETDGNFMKSNGEGHIYPRAHPLTEYTGYIGTFPTNALASIVNLPNLDHPVTPLSLPRRACSGASAACS